MTRPSHPPIRGLARSDARACAAYAEAAGVHRIVPQLIARPLDADDVADLVRWAITSGAALTPRGAGSSMAGAAVGSGTIVDLRDLAPRRLEIDPDRRTARVSANITLAELAQAAAVHGLHFPPDPSSSAWATVGGVIGTNAAGPRSVRDGAVRSWVEALTFVDGTARQATLARGQQTPRCYLALHELLRFHRQRVRSAFPATAKNSSGYALDHAGGDLLHLLIGAEGTLGIITEAVLRLAPLPIATRALRLDLADIDQLPEVVAVLLPHRPAAVELLDASYLALGAPQLSPQQRAELAPLAAVLLVTLEADSEDELQTQLESIRHALAEAAVALHEARTAEAAAALWSIRHAASPILASLVGETRSLQVIEDGCVPLPELARYIHVVRSACSAAGVPYAIFGHAGDGHLHVNLLPTITEPDWLPRVAQIYREVSSAVRALGGTLSGEHGDGRLRAPLLRAQYPVEIIELFEFARQTFDPHRILNPGVILGGHDADPFASLKVGEHAAALPADIAHGLRAIEQTRGWGTDRLQLADGPGAAAMP